MSLTRTKTTKQSLARLKKGRGKEKKYRKRWKSGWNQQKGRKKKGGCGHYTIGPPEGARTEGGGGGVRLSGDLINIHEKPSSNWPVGVA